MARKSRKSRTEGTLIRGADGLLYFIPDDKLEAFRVPEKDEDAASALLDRLAVEKRHRLTAASGHEVCEDLRLITAGRRKPRSK